MLQMKDIVREGHPALRTVADDVVIPPSKEDQLIADQMFEYLKNSQDEDIAEKYNLRSGVGLAAPQIGITKQIFVVHFRDKKDHLYSYQLFNPKIISHSVEQAYLANGEGCLSVDRDVEGFVVRNARITIRAFDRDGNPLKIRLRGYPAIVFQHEIDHLQGIMFYDHISKHNPFEIPKNAKEIE